MPRFVAERVLNVWDEQDGGQSRIAHFEFEEVKDADRGLFVRLQSWDDLEEHREWNMLKGKRIRITLETID